ncbi:hypothetical protein [Peptoniphilus catoniae]|uniref:DsrE family protein n=1 Tax=Peptoniphilus catoniae TaxID=1660341 RepID=UPI0010FD5CF1|nr:hypothetical protein [Peptoniphilus catoniae]
MKVIFHIVEIDKWEDTMANIKDLVTRVPDANVEIIAMSKAASLFGRYVGMDFDGVLGRPNVKWVIGEKGMKDHSITREMLPDYVIVEPSVILRIARLQNEGYAYIRL